MNWQQQRDEDFDRYLETQDAATAADEANARRWRGSEFKPFLLFPEDCEDCGRYTDTQPCFMCRMEQRRDDLEMGAF